MLYTSCGAKGSAWLSDRRLLEQLVSKIGAHFRSNPLRENREGLFRPPNSISGASRADSSGSGHLPEQENTVRDSGSDAGATIHASFRPLHRAAAGRLRTIYKKRLFSRGGSGERRTKWAGSGPVVGRSRFTSGSLLGRPYFGSLPAHFGPLLCHTPSPRKQSSVRNLERGAPGQQGNVEDMDAGRRDAASHHADAAGEQGGVGSEQGGVEQG